MSGQSWFQEGIVPLLFWQMNNVNEVNGSIQKLIPFGDLGPACSVYGLQKQSFGLLQLNQMTKISLTLEGQNTNKLKNISLSQCVKYWSEVLFPTSLLFAWDHASHSGMDLMFLTQLKLTLAQQVFTLKVELSKSRFGLYHYLSFPQWAVVLCINWHHVCQSFSHICYLTDLPRSFNICSWIFYDLMKSFELNNDISTTNKLSDFIVLHIFYFGFHCDDNQTALYMWETKPVLSGRLFNVLWNWNESVLNNVWTQNESTQVFLGGEITCCFNKEKQIKKRKQTTCFRKSRPQVFSLIQHLQGKLYDVESTPKPISGDGNLNAFNGY